MRMKIEPARACLQTGSPGRSRDLFL